MPSPPRLLLFYMLLNARAQNEEPGPEAVLLDNGCDHQEDGDTHQENHGARGRTIENRTYREEFTRKKCKTAILLYCFHTASVLYTFVLYILGTGTSFSKSILDIF